MSKVPLRLLLGAGMLATLFFPWNPSADSERYPNAFYISVTTLGVLSTMTEQATVADFVGALGIVLFLQAVPILIVFSILLSIRPLDKLKTVYRILAWSLAPWAWYASLFLIDPGWRGPGFWMHTTAISIVAFVEMALFVREQLRRQSAIAHNAGDPLNS